VKASRENLQRMLDLSGGRRDVPMVVEGDRVQFGFGGT
jgi:hypothetical protein